MLLLEQVLNGLQLGVMLFVLAAGLTLVLGIMNLVNLAHGSLYMVGAFIAASAAQWTGAFLPGLFGAALGPAAASGVGAALASMAIYLLMAAVLVWRPRGLFPAHG